METTRRDGTAKCVPSIWNRVISGDRLASPPSLQAAIPDTSTAMTARLVIPILLPPKTERISLPPPLPSAQVGSCCLNFEPSAKATVIGHCVTLK